MGYSRLFLLLRWVIPACYTSQVCILPVIPLRCVSCLFLFFLVLFPPVSPLSGVIPACYTLGGVYPACYTMGGVYPACLSFRVLFPPVGPGPGVREGEG